MADLVFRGTRQQLQQVLASLPAILAGRAADPHQVARGLQLRVGVALLSQVQQDYLTKARGGTGRDGVKWKPLKPETIARRRRTAGDTKAARVLVRQAKQAGQKRPSVKVLYGSRQVEILIDTRRLFRSLSPGVEDRPSNAPGQIFEHKPGAVIVGTNAPYAVTHQIGDTRRKIPARPFLPVGGKIPDAYWPAILAASARGVIQALRLIITQGGSR